MDKQLGFASSLGSHGLRRVASHWGHAHCRNPPSNSQSSEPAKT
jgi:hypothetical protein